uniref:Choline transporter-like protein n=1 Tax=Culicoides sonorensis TaxID=179676 RepID=A0A336LM49_CULSO
MPKQKSDKNSKIPAKIEAESEDDFENVELQSPPAHRVQIEVQDPLVEYRTRQSSVEPLRKNQCTDVICLLIFVIFFGMVIFVGFFAMTKGEDNRILTPIDSNENFCGKDSNVLDVPYLYILDLYKCIDIHSLLVGCTSDSICVSKCPDKDFNVTDCTENDIERIRKEILCDTFVDKKEIHSCEDVEKLVEEKRCASEYVTTKSISRICMPRDIISTLNETFLARLFKFRLFSGFRDIAIEAINQIKSEWKEIVGCTLSSILICLAFIFLLRWFAGPIIWISVFGLLGILLAGSVFSFMRYSTLKNNPEEQNRRLTNVKALIQNLFDKTDTWLWVACILTIIFSIILIVVSCIFKRIRIAIEIVKEGSRAVNSSIFTMFFPIVPLILQGLTILFIVYVYLKLNTLGDHMYKLKGVRNYGDSCKCSGEFDYKERAICDPTTFKNNCTEVGTGDLCKKVKCAFEEEDSLKITIFKCINVFGGIWLISFLSAFNEIVLASVYSRWYWTYNKSKVPFCALCTAVYRTFRYHIGTIAFGSLLIAICRILRLMVEYIKAQCDKYPNKFTQFIIWVFRCVFWCLEHFIQFVNQNAYIMCAIKGTNFCKSAKDAFTLLLQNGIRFTALFTVTTCLFMMCKLLISIGVATLVLIYVHNYEMIAPAILVGIGTYIIADLFFGVYSMANKTMFLCSLEDASKNDGSKTHPYFMSRRLSKLLTKSSKRESTIAEK